MSFTHPQARSWIDVKPGSDFPIQNLPFGIFKTRSKSPRAGVAIGEYILDLEVLYAEGYFNRTPLADHGNVFAEGTLNKFIGLGKAITRPVRERIAEILNTNNPELRDNADIKQKALVAQTEAQMLMPVHVPNYTDFYSSIEHATNVGKMFRDPANPLLPNWKHLPVGYHGRASSIVVSGTPIHRPKGQTKPDDAPAPVFGPSRSLDFELEVAFVTNANTALGQSISTRKAEEYIFGLVLFNDWSARDIQKWEYVPLGPFLGKNFGSTVSPWIVTLEALEPFRTDTPAQEPAVLPYLQFEGKKSYDIHLEVEIMPESGKGMVVTRTNFKYMYWNMAQQLAHHTVNGCNICVGDLYASGTISGPDAGSYGSLLEITWQGKNPLKMPDGTERKFLLDGDTVIMRGYCEKDGLRIGFGECAGKILPAV
ncbi:MAG: fumarylacetoacetase [Chitinophagales bacterium]|nr:fumarylacetoacetase [Chitinophagales bacterium]MDW8420170.1 fumarylacetoacetase [Chitinophagales bacterium]